MSIRSVPGSIRLVLSLFMMCFLLTACGGGEESLDGKGGLTPPTGDNDDGVTDPIASNEINVRVEATSGMQSATVSQQLFNILTPRKAMAIDAGEAVSATLRVQQLDFAGTVIANYGNVSAVNNNDGTYTLIFDSRIPDRLDYVITATLANGTRIRRALPNSNEGVSINAATEYAVQRFFSSFATQDELDDLLPCTTSGCEDQADVHMLNWQAFNGAIQDFEITIPDSADLDEALDLLGDNPLVSDYADQFIETIKEEKIDSVDDNEIAPALASRSGNYNAVMFAMGMNQGSPEQAIESNRSVIFTNRTSSVLENTSTDVTSYTYPRVVLSSNFLGIVNNLIVEQIPWYRNSVVQSGSDSFSQSLTSRDADINRQEGTVLTYLSPKGHFDMARLQTQVVTEEGGLSTGWLNNPFFTRYYSTKAGSAEASSVEGIASAYLADGLVFRLNQVSEDNFERSTLLEETHSFGWMYALKTTNSKDFSINTLDTNYYGVIRLNQKLGATNPVEMEASIERWYVDDTDIIVDQPVLGGGNPEIFRTYTTGRSATSGLPAIPVSSSTGLTDSLSLSALDSPGSATTTPNANLDGRISATGGISLGDWIGASDPDGNMLVLKSDDDTVGQGMVHAIKMSNLAGDAAPEVNLADKRYVLYGNSFMATDSETVFSNYNRSTITFDASEVGTLDLRELTLTQAIGDPTLSDISDNSSTYTTQPTATPDANTDPDTRNLVRLEFADPTGGSDSFILEGFASSDNTALVLMLRYGERIGVVYGFLEQSLTASSD